MQPEALLLHLKSPCCQEEYVSKTYCEKVVDACGQVSLVEKQYWEKMNDPTNLPCYWIGRRDAPPLINLDCAYSECTMLIASLILLCLIAGLGYLFYYLYQWSDHNPIVGYWCPTNDSVWELFKMIYFPSLIVAFFLWFIIGSYTKNYVFATAMGIIFACAIFFIIYYFFANAVGYQGKSMETLAYVVSLILGIWLFLVIARADPFPHWGLIVGYVLLLLLGIFLIMYTYNHPDIPIFNK